MKCILHIGTEKTASTAIQRFVYAERGKLLEAGVGLGLYNGSCNYITLANYFSGSMVAGHQDDSIIDLEHQIEMARSHYCSVFLITSEHFHSRLTDINEIGQLYAFLITKFSEIEVLCYFREQSEVVAGKYSTEVRTYGYTGTLSQFYNAFRDKYNCSHWYTSVAVKDHYLNYYNFISKWGSVFGVDNLKLRLFGFQHGDIRKAFLRELHADVPFLRFDFSHGAANVSLSETQIELGRIINASSHPRAGELVEAMARSNMRQLPRFENTEAERIYAEFNDSNKKLGKEFLNVDGNPFKLKNGIHGLT